jgi:hypothetical protein
MEVKSFPDRATSKNVLEESMIERNRPLKEGIK